MQSLKLALLLVLQDLVFYVCLIVHTLHSVPLSPLCFLYSSNQETKLLTTHSNNDRMDVKSQTCWWTVSKCGSWLLQVLVGVIYAVAFQKNRISYTLVYLTPPDYNVLSCSVQTLIFTLFTQSSISVELHYCNSSAFSLHGWCNHELSNVNHSFSMQVRVGHRCAATTISEKLDGYSCFQYDQFLMFCFTPFLKSPLYISLSSLQFL